MSELSDEIRAMASIEAALTPLDEEARGRVLRWASERYGVLTSTTARPVMGPTGAVATGKSESSAYEPPQFTDLADLFAAAAPKTEADRVLVTGYWFQVVKGEPDLEAATVNKELKHLGHGIKNITTAFGSLITRKPQLAIQTRKAGSSQQARKKFKLTEEGKKHVLKMISSRSSEGE